MQDQLSRHQWLAILGATTILLITTGVRQSFGLFLAPIVDAEGLGIAEVSFALAVAQLVWGASQPLFGAYADRHGPGGVLGLGAVLLAVGTACAPMLPTGPGLIFTVGMLGAAGAGAGSFSVLLGATASRIPAGRSSMAAGLINAGGSLGQFLFAPMTQLAIALGGWALGFKFLALAALGTLPLAWLLRRPEAPTPAPSPAESIGLRQQLSSAFRDRSYLCLHAGFFTCGFHIAFLVTHLPTQIELCGLPGSFAATSIALIGLFNVAGSLAAGWLGQRFLMREILALLYLSRAATIGIFLLSPPSATTFVVFSSILGLTWLATVPPTAGLIGKLFGTRHLGTLFGLTLLSHQVGGFAGAWLGGIAVSRQGTYAWMWYADIVLALLATLANFPIREQGRSLFALLGATRRARASLCRRASAADTGNG